MASPDLSPPAPHSEAERGEKSKAIDLRFRQFSSQPQCSPFSPPAHTPAAGTTAAGWRPSSRSSIAAHFKSTNPYTLIHTGLPAVHTRRRVPRRARHQRQDVHRWALLLGQIAGAGGVDGRGIPSPALVWPAVCTRTARLVCARLTWLFAGVPYRVRGLVRRSNRPDIWACRRRGTSCCRPHSRSAVWRCRMPSTSTITCCY